MRCSSRIIVDVSRAHIRDISSVQALDMTVAKSLRNGAEVQIVGMNEGPGTIVDELATHDEPDAIEKLTAQ